MKAILTNELGVYREHNGKTFEVVSLNFSQATLLIEDSQVDTPTKNILIVDVDAEYQRLYDSTNWGSRWASYTMHALLAYAEQHDIKLKTPTYNCPP